MEYQYTEEVNRFVVKDEQDKEAGEVTFTRAGNHILIIDHTGVETAHRGQGLAEELVRKVVDKAKREELKIMPLCPFAKKEFEKNVAYQEFQHK
ncbi:GNAT family N-acetyltransferase [Oceanobacillus saliphilus]|uniref:GNAT family N-acetyltransferase n=1 Tax=Oceanobacillus saliphilus TaxID=2925834 RepID=UPI00201E58F0|nr:GNAT family N-acetyltransferase [Oceanobacillus saliphilus]